jgi:hypothetical protein
MHGHTGTQLAKRDALCWQLVKNTIADRSDTGVDHLKGLLLLGVVTLKLATNQICRPAPFDLQR